MPPPQSSLQQNYTEELSFYQNYHTQPINSLIHAIAVPFEWLSVLLIITKINATVCFFVSVGVMVYYALVLPPWMISESSILAREMNWVFKSMVLVIPLVMARLAQWVVEGGHYLCGGGGWGGVLLLAGFVNVISWGVQVGIGHYIIEKNKPGMATQLTLNSIVLSPLLAWHGLALTILKDKKEPSKTK